MGERSRLEAYRGQLRSYQAAPAYYKASLYLDALKSAMAESRVFITDAANKLSFRFNMEDRDTSAAEIIRSNPN
jgi:hypothetical protein